MKKIALLFPLLLILFLSSCDKVDQPLKNPPYGPMVPVIDSTQLNRVQQRILVEDFTGASCVNCTKAADKTENLSLEYPGRIIAIGIHCGPYSVPNTDHPEDFRCQTSTDFYNFFQPQFFPVGMINRLDYTTNNNLTLVDNWNSKIENEVDTTLKMEVYIDSLQDLSGNQIKAYVRVKAFRNIASNNLYICGLLVENHITAPQTLPDNSVKDDYEHMHVLRTSFNGSFGESISTSGMSQGQEIAKNFTVQIDPGWVKENLSAVFYVYDHDDYHVVQVNKLDMK